MTRRTRLFRFVSVIVAALQLALSGTASMAWAGADTEAVQAPPHFGSCSNAASVRLQARDSALRHFVAAPFLPAAPPRLNLPSVASRRAAPDPSEAGSTAVTILPQSRAPPALS